MQLTDNHTDLCKRLRVLRRNWSKELGESAVKSADLIEQQAARIAMLEKERDALKADAARDAFQALIAKVPHKPQAITYEKGWELLDELQRIAEIERLDRAKGE